MKRQAFESMNPAAVAFVHSMLASAWELFGGSDSSMPEPDDQLAKDLIERALDTLNDYMKIEQVES